MGTRARWTIGLVMIVHAFAHSLPGMRALDGVPGWLSGEAGPGSLGLEVFAAALLATAMGCLLAGGLGALGASPFRRIWRELGVAGSVSSIVLLISFRPPMAFPGSALSALLMGLVVWVGNNPKTSDPATAARRWGRRLGGALALVLVGYTAAAVLARPWHLRWGSTSEELRAQLPGDELTEMPTRYAIQHAVTIQAPSDVVWAWLVQIGQDRAGFYSHDWLERLFGADIRNRDEIVPAWQQRAVGDSVFATQPGYLGIFEQPLGWRVSRVDPGSALVLENWGAFVVVPLGPDASRLIVRTRGGGVQEESLLDVLVGPATLLAFELPHFIMERRMLLGIKERAEARPFTAATTAGVDPYNP